MFGSLKKKLKEAVEKVSKAISKEDAKEVQAKTIEEKERLPEPLPRESVSQEKPALTIEERLEEKIEEKVERLKELEEKIEEERIPAALREEAAEERRILEEIREEELLGKDEAEGAADRKRVEGETLVSPLEKKGVLAGIRKKITEKTLTEAEIEKVMKELQTALLENDVAYEAAEKICDGVKGALANTAVKRGRADDVIKNSLKKSMLAMMQQQPVSLETEIEKKGKPYLIVFCGFNGTGKTTTIAKLAKRLKIYKPVLAAGDTFRAASIEQLEEHGKKLGVKVVKHKYGSDSAAVIFDAVKHAEAAGSRVVIADTAGRSHSNVNLMDELRKLVRVNKPDLKVLVLDSLTGNDIYDQSRLFNEAIGVDAIILTKADVYEKGGAALSASYTLKKPVLFLGTGQEYDDLKEFDAEEIVSGLLE